MSDDTPINKHAGSRVIKLGEYRISRGISRRKKSHCPHNNMNYSISERRIYCADCDSNVEPFDAFISILGPYDSAWEALKRKRQKLNEDISENFRRIAAKKLDAIWRGNRFVPVCPHCKNGLMLDDMKDIRTTSKKNEVDKRRNGLRICTDE